MSRFDATGDYGVRAVLEGRLRPGDAPRGGGSDANGDGIRALSVGDHVHVPGRFNFLTIQSISGGRALATFSSGFGFVDLPIHEFRPAFTPASKETP